MNAQTDDVIAQIAQDYLKESRRKRRWRIFFRLLLLILAISILLNMLPTKRLDKKDHVGLIDIKGNMFDSTTKANADNVAKALQKAYKDKKTKAIIIRINSPGGSPVQADYIFNEIMRMRKAKPKIKVYAVCTDICTSAAYYVAAAADQIYANQASLIGSIGVLYNGFGFTGIMDKLGVERRLITAGNSKGFMDPFSKLKPNDTQALKAMLEKIHLRFEHQVEKGRGKRLVKDPEIFSGLFWTGTQAKKLGLIDGFGSAGYVAREIVKVDRIKNYTVKPNYLDRLSKSFGTAMSRELLTQLFVWSPNQANALA